MQVSWSRIGFCSPDLLSIFFILLWENPPEKKGKRMGNWCKDVFFLFFDFSSVGKIDEIRYLNSKVEKGIRGKEKASGFIAVEERTKIPGCIRRK